MKMLFVIAQFVLQHDSSGSNNLIVEFKSFGAKFSNHKESITLPLDVDIPLALVDYKGRLFLSGVNVSNVGKLWELDPDGSDREGTEVRGLPK